MTFQETLQLLMDTAPTHWEALPDTVRREAIAEHVSNMQAMIQCATLLSVYLDERTDMGASHGQAVRRANSARRKVRKALGYSYPAAGEHTW